jgi:hypothetical protein
VEIPGREENSKCKRKLYNKNPRIVLAYYVAGILDTKVDLLNLLTVVS